MNEVTKAPIDASDTTDRAIVAATEYPMQHWFFLAGAIIFEVAGTASMKISDGFSKLTPSISMGVCYAFSLFALTFALKKIEVSVAYAIWSGLGTVLISLVGITWFRESITPIKLVSIALIIIGVVGLNLGGARN